MASTTANHHATYVPLSHMDLTLVISLHLA